MNCECKIMVFVLHLYSDITKPFVSISGIWAYHKTSPDSGVNRIGTMLKVMERFIYFPVSYFIRLSSVFVMFLLFAKHCLLLSLSFFQSGHKTAFLSRFFCSCSHARSDFLFAYKVTESICLDNSNQK